MYQLMCALRYYATGSQQLAIVDFCGFSCSSANRVVHRVSKAIASLSQKYIKLPQTRAEMQQVQMGFYNIAKFPSVLGALDCTHIKIISPGK